MPHTRPLRATRAALRPARLASLLVLLLGAALSAHAADKDGSFSAGLNIQPTATPEKLGLPYYPGAVPHVEKGDEKPGATIAAWGGVFGLQLQAMKLRSNASPQTVAQWYHEQLARLGPVLDCSQGKAADPPPLPDKKADQQLLRCGDDRPEPGGALYKLGTRADARVVAVKPGEPGEGGSRIALVRIQLKNFD
jgi:hypothetical protein